VIVRVLLVSLFSISVASCSADNPNTDEQNMTEVAVTEEQKQEIMERLGGSAQIMAALDDAGEDLSDRRPAELFFYGNYEALESLKNDAVLSSYQVRDIKDPIGVSIATEVVTDDAWVAQTAHDMVLLASKYGVKYDGWEAGLVRQGNQP